MLNTGILYSSSKQGYYSSLSLVGKDVAREENVDNQEEQANNLPTLADTVVAMQKDKMSSAEFVNWAKDAGANITFFNKNTLECNLGGKKIQMFMNNTTEDVSNPETVSEIQKYTPTTIEQSRTKDVNYNIPVTGFNSIESVNSYLGGISSDPKFVEQIMTELKNDICNNGKTDNITSDSAGVNCRLSYNLPNGIATISNDTTVNSDVYHDVMVNDYNINILDFNITNNDSIFSLDVDTNCFFNYVDKITTLV